MLWIKALHVVSVIAWMAGLFYLPRLYVYHTRAKPGSELSETLKVMERKLLRIINTPAMIASWATGIWLLVLTPEFLHEAYFHVKLTLLVLLTAFHGYLARCRRKFAEDRNARPEVFYRVINEIPTVLMIGIVIMVIVKPEF